MNLYKEQQVIKRLMVNTKPSTVGLVISTFNEVTQSGSHQQVFHFYNTLMQSNVGCVKIFIFDGFEINNHSRKNLKV